MQLSDVRSIADTVITSMRSTFGGAVDNINLFDVCEVSGHNAFSIAFTLYDYYCMRFNYEKGRFGACIVFGNYAITIPSSYKWINQVAHLDLYWTEVNEEIRLRIPDAYLGQNGLQ